MKTAKPFLINRYAVSAKFFLTVIFCLSTLCCSNKQTQRVLTKNGGKLFAANAVDINKATASELEKIPQIGAKTAQKIIEHRQKYGNFRKPEFLLLVNGISDKKFRLMKEFVTTE